MKSSSVYNLISKMYLNGELGRQEFSKIDALTKKAILDSELKQIPLQEIELGTLHYLRNVWGL